MAKDEYFDVHLEGDRELELALDLYQTRAQARLRGIVGGWAHYTLSMLRIYVHVDSGYTLRHTDTDGPRWRPGGAGGSGEWESVVGVRRGESMHPLYADQGTGIYVGRGVITREGLPRPKLEDIENVPFTEWGWAKDNKMPIRRGGVLVGFAVYTRGQKPQHFLYATAQMAKVYAEARIANLGRDLLH